MLFVFLVPTQIHHQTVTATWCIKEMDETTNREREWYYSRGEGHCDYLNGLEDPKIKDKKVYKHYYSDFSFNDVIVSAGIPWFWSSPVFTVHT